MVSPADTVRVVGHTPALAVGSGHAAHLLDSFPALAGAADTPAYIFDTDTVVVECLASVASASGSANASGAR